MGRLMEFFFERHMAHQWTVLLVKLPLMRLKISWLSVGFHFVAKSAPEAATAAWELLTGWYSILQLLPTFAAHARCRDRRTFMCSAVPFALTCILVLDQMLHMMGVLACSSRDFSVFHGGCTAPVNA